MAVARGLEAFSSGEEDCTMVFQAAVDSTPVFGELRVPLGAYKISSAIVVSKDISIIGVSQLGTRIFQQDGASDCIFVNPQQNGIQIRIENLGITGGRNGIYITGTGVLGKHYVSRKSRLKDLYLSSQSSAGIKIDTGMIGCHHESIELENTGDYGIYSWGPDSLGCTTWKGLRIAGARVHGFHIRNADTEYPEQSTGENDQSSVVLENPIFEGNPGSAIYAFSTHVSIIGGHFEHNGSSGKADLVMDTNYSIEKGVNFCWVRMIGTYFSVGEDGQDNTRIRLLGNGCRLSLRSVRMKSFDRINGGGISASSSIFIDEPIEVPTVENFSGHLRIEEVI